MGLAGNGISADELSLGQRPFSQINSGDWKVGTDRRAVRLDVGR